MKKCKRNKKAPAYAFGVEQINAAASTAQLLGTGLQGFSEEDSNANIAGSALSGLGTGVAAGAAFGPIGAGIGAVIGGVGGAMSGLVKKNTIQKQEKRQRTADLTQAGLANAAIAEQKYWDKNNLAYTFENGGVLPDLAYLDNNEVVRDDFGNITKVPNTKKGTDNHLVDATTLDSVLSDKLKVPGTNKTFAQEGKKLTSMMKPSKGKDRFAQNSNMLNKINANKAYESLLAQQEEVKAKKGIKPKVKGVPAYEDGKDSKRYIYGVVPESGNNIKYKIDLETGEYFDGNRVLAGISKTMQNRNKTLNQESLETLQRSEIPANKSQIVQPGKLESIPGIYPEYTSKFNVRQWNPTWSKALGYAIKDNKTTFDDLYDYASGLTNDFLDSANWASAFGENMITPATGASYKNYGYNSSKNTDNDYVDGVSYADPKIKTTTPTKSATTTVSQSVETPSTPTAKPTAKGNTKSRKINLSKTPMLTTTLDDTWLGPSPVMPISKPTTGPVVNTDNADAALLSKQYEKGTKPSGNFDFNNLLSLAPTLYNFAQSFKEPEYESTVVNPYASAATRSMARRRMNIEPTLAANRRARAVASYNAANMNANTGANLALRSQLAADEYARNADLYAARDNANNAYLGEYSNLLNNLGQQYVQSRTLANDINAKNRAAARNYQGTALSQLGKWAQTQELMKNQYNRDLMALPLLENYLSQGFTADQVKEVFKRTKNRA